MDAAQDSVADGSGLDAVDDGGTDAGPSDGDIEDGGTRDNGGSAGWDTGTEDPGGDIGLGSVLASTVAAGMSHTCAVTTSGGVKCWGDNYYGQLGDGTVVDKVTPVDVSGFSGDLAAVSASWDHTCALTTSGGVKCWGLNDEGQLGDGTTKDKPTPVEVSGLSSGVKAISAGGGHSCALTTTDGVKCWGDNNYGQLGDGTAEDNPMPVDVSGLSGGVVAVVGGYQHTCALTTAGGVKCWGDNYNGQLGELTTIINPTPVDVSDLSSGVKAIAAGGFHTCALTTAGGVKCWGDNYYGQLGDGTTTNNPTPVDVSDLSSGVAAVSAGWDHTCALTTSGGVKCWGSNNYGQLGDGTTKDGPMPVDVSGLLDGVETIAAGGDHTCAVTISGGVKCWGANNSGQLGDGIVVNKPTPVDVSGLAIGVESISAGGDHTCAVTSSGGVKCWGANNSGQLGAGTWSEYVPTPVDVSGLSNGVAAVSAGFAHTCALTTSGGVKCWGTNGYGGLGDGTTTGKTSPVDVSGLSSGVVAIAAGAFFTCALTTSGGVKCWGDNICGQLGDGTELDKATPVDVLALSSDVKAIDAGFAHTCAVTTSGGVKCWGYNGDGQLGDGTLGSNATPVDVYHLASGVKAINASLAHTCAVTNTGGLKCWGENGLGQLGDGTTEDSPMPVDVSGLSSGVTAVVAGYQHTCALTTTGGVKCWGYNDEGQLGNGTTIPEATPVDVSGPSDGAKAVAAGGDHTCALTTSGGVKCWGLNDEGQLGDGKTTPVDVVGFGF